MTEAVDPDPNTPQEDQPGSTLGGRTVPGDRRDPTAGGRDGEAGSADPATDPNAASIAADDGKAVTSRGWYRIEPGKCLHPDVTGQPRKIFSFAEAVDSEGRTIKINSRPVNWGGATMLCTRETQFEFSEQGDCGARGLNASGYAQVDMPTGAGKTLRFGMP